MPDAPEIPETSRMQIYLDGIITGLYDNKTKQEIADLLGVDRRTLLNWNKKIDWPHILEQRRKLYVQDIMEIDAAMLRESKKGSVPASELCYRRFDGYVPENKITAEMRKDQDLLAEAEKIKQELMRGQAGPTGPDLPGAGPAPSV
jgi:hypothetical protein